ncbi:tetraspanin 37 [Amia ocellicauda]|uniref:tetraspanin 37 n=1 Tax=Amia ocellicauda TaxID=2972642 RepID=UPI0034645121|nr:TSN3 protein [Amia calva]
MSEPRGVCRTVLRIACQLLWLAGLVLGLSGVYLLLKYLNCGLFFHNIYIIFPAVLAIVAAGFLLGAGTVGCWVSGKESPCLQGLFVYLLIAVFCLEATAAVLAYININKVDSELSPFKSIFQKYNGSRQDPDTSAVDAIQKELQCCGVRDYRDWLNTRWFNQTGHPSVPHSCCNSTYRNCDGNITEPELLYSEGCQVKLEVALVFILHLIIILTAVVAVFQVVGLVSVAQLMKEQPLQEYQILDREAIS